MVTRKRQNYMDMLMISVWLLRYCCWWYIRHLQVSNEKQIKCKRIFKKCKKLICQKNKMFGFIEKCFYSNDIFSYNLLNVNPLKCISMNIKNGK